MESLDLLSIESKVWQCTRNKEKVNNAILQELLQLVPLAQKMFDDVNTLALKREKRIDFEVISKEKVKYIAYTQNYRKSIAIHLTSPMEGEQVKSVFVHELGEVEYLVSGFPFFDDPSEDVMYRIVEIFSHPRIRELSKQHGLGDLEGRFNNEFSTSQLTRDYPNEFLVQWKIVLMISWAIITFPDINSRKEEINGYTGYKDTIDKILLIRNAVNTFSSSEEEVRKAFNDIIDVLKGLGMPDPGRII